MAGQTRKITEFPRVALFAAAFAIASALGSVGYAAFNPAEPEPIAGTPSLVRDLRFQDRADGAVVVWDASDNSVVSVADPGTNGFLRASLRGLARERKRMGITQEPPFRLTSWEDGQLTLQDTATGRTVFLAAFGHTNNDVFARLLTVREAPKP